MSRVAVVGGGIAGLAAARFLAAGGADVVVLEGSDAIGGKLRLGEVGGVTIDLGAESILARRPEALDLAADVGLSDRLTHPETIAAGIWTRGVIRRLPRTVQGVPADLDDLADTGIVERVPVPRSVPVPEHDVPIASHVAERVGQEVVDRLVEPLLGGVYAGHASRLSLDAAAPQIKALGPDLVAGAAASTARPTMSGPVFAGLVGGVGQLPAAVAAASGAEIRTGTTVRAIGRTHVGWELVVGPTNAIERIAVDGVVVATPAPAAGRLLAEVAPEAAFALADVEYASMAIVSLVLDHALPGEGSGFLVPPVDGRTIKASTVSSRKWGWLASQGATVLRASLGRAGESAVLQQPDDALVAAALADLAEAFGEPLRPAATHVQRWGGALPQYAVGHLDLVETVEGSVRQVDGLEVCGAAYRGVGIPAVVASARRAADALLATLGTMGS